MRQPQVHTATCAQTLHARHRHVLACMHACIHACRFPSEQPCTNLQQPNITASLALAHAGLPLLDGCAPQSIQGPVTPFLVTTRRQIGWSIAPLGRQLGGARRHALPQPPPPQCGTSQRSCPGLLRQGQPPVSGAAGHGSCDEFLIDSTAESPMMRPNRLCVDAPLKSRSIQVLWAL